MSASLRAETNRRGATCWKENAEIEKAPDVGGKTEASELRAP